jgi:hypothetical protein
MNLKYYQLSIRLHNYYYVPYFRSVILFSSMLKKIYSYALVAHTCNPSYSGGRDQED